MERTIDHAPARWWHAVADGSIQCDLCPHGCTLREGQRGACFVRANLQGAMSLTTYGRSSGFAIDPIEKKPLYHFYPGSQILSFGTAGCNLSCRFCQNWQLSHAQSMDTVQESAPPQAIAQAAKRSGAQSVAFTYNDPVIFAEYAMDTADACHALGIHTVAVTAGFMNLTPAREFFSRMDGANIDLKSFRDEFYVRWCRARLQPVLDLIAMVRHETSCWLELTTLLIPGLNDTTEEITAMAQWCYRELGPDVPLHFSAFFPTHQLQDVVATPVQTLVRARKIALDAGMHYVYVGNVSDRDGESTWCSGCGARLIDRHRYTILGINVEADGTCGACGTVLAGRFG
ncbi:AmmeMemoRadiSam system radical SAM enzyme [Chrysiogenes arsenatis]|uniref:AmmeMemoRadiSam system radical SAM enzyme n=1 Tax=Chrysiogenes arsenatis TaxID=309797 RepID=UPI0003FBFF50|nr:AmmeMemoRadiSam system radical SAM enzyme [Chrysiogenes arsenatis]